MSANVNLISALAGAGAVLSPLWARIATSRSMAQPVDYAPEAERAVLAALVVQPGWIAELEPAGFSADCFAQPERRRAYVALRQAWLAEGGEIPEAAEVATEAVMVDEAGVDRIVAQLMAELGGEGAVLAELVDADRIRRLDEGADGPYTREELEGHARKLVAAWEDRDRWSGFAPIVETGEEPPLRRHFDRVPTRRWVTAALYGLIGGAAVAVLGSGPWAIAVLFATMAYGYVIAAVDHDTLLIDTKVFVVGTCGIWAAVGAGALGGAWGWSAVLLGVGVALGWGVVFELTNAAYKLVRGVDGLGFGDAMIGLVCVGVPTAVSGSLTVGIYSVIAAMFVALLVQVPLMVIRGGGRQMAFALGPYLAVGWVVAWFAARAIGLT